MFSTSRYLSSNSNHLCSQRRKILVLRPLKLSHNRSFGFLSWRHMSSPTPSSHTVPSTGASIRTRQTPIVLLPAPRSHIHRSASASQRHIGPDMTNSHSNVWFITGCATGFGNLTALEALRRGDRVIATARGNLSRLDELKAAGAYVMECDVTVSVEEMQAVAKNAEAVYGRVDVVLNNAGYGKFGTLEELGPNGLLEQYKTNVFGTANVTSAFLPYFRDRRSGTIVITGSRSGARVVPMAGAYGTSKAAINLYGETLAKEVSPFNVRVLTLVPGGFHTSGVGGNPVLPPPPGSGFEDYQPLYDWFKKIVEGMAGSQPGDPAKYATLMVDVVRGEGIMLQHEGVNGGKGKSEEEGNEKGDVRPWPERLVVGSDAVDDIKATFKSWEQSIDEYGDMTRSTDKKTSDE